MQNNYSMLNTNNINHNTLVKSSIKHNSPSNLINTRKNNPTNNVLQKQQPNPPSKPPPTLPKPKFILPQTSATNLVLQRNLKSKSELNIATTTNTTSSLSSCSTDSAASSSSSSSCCSSSTINPKQTKEASLPKQSIVTSTGHPLRNKILENSSLVSSSQGYQSDTWESHSSRQSFDMDSQPTASNSSSFINNTTNNNNRLKQFNKVSSKLAIESKLAKTTSLNRQNESSSSHSCSSSASSSSSSANAIGSSCSDGSINGGIASGSDDTDSSLPPSQKNYAKLSKSNLTSHMNGGIELPIYYQTSTKTFNTNNEEELNNYSTLIKNVGDGGGEFTNGAMVTSNNNSSYTELYEK